MRLHVMFGTLVVLALASPVLAQGVRQAEADPLVAALGADVASANTAVGHVIEKVQELVNAYYRQKAELVAAKAELDRWKNYAKPLYEAKPSTSGATPAPAVSAPK